MLEISIGISPSNRFSPIRRTIMLENIPIELGIVPEIELLDMHNTTNLVLFLNTSSSVPLNLLLSRNNTSINYKRSIIQT
jgi:hypothetical protein